MQNNSLFRIAVFTLTSIFVFSISSANADGNRLKTVSGVIVPVPNSDPNIAFPPDPRFFVTNPDPGIFIVSIEKRLRCTFNGNLQASIGVRLATPANDLAPNNNYYITSQLAFFDSDEAGVCNDVAHYQFNVRNRSDNSLVNRPFSFQITGSKVKKSSDDDEEDDD